MNIEANRTFFIIGILLFNYLLFSGRRRALGLADACRPSARAKTTAAWTLTDISGSAEISARHNCVCACFQLVER